MSAFRVIWFLALFCLSLGFLPATQLVVSTGVGFDSLDCTNYLQYALGQSTEDTIVIDNVGQDWRTGPLSVNRDSVVIIFEAGVVLRALPGAFGIYESLLRIRDRRHIHISGYGATFLMNRQEYLNLGDSEYRHGISLGSATDITIEGLTVRDSGGDGLIMTKSFQPTSLKNYCEDITVRNCRFIRNYRQGMSITSVRNVLVTNCEFAETSGTLPEAGIDIEPDEPSERIENLVIRDCRFLRNHGNGIQVALFYMADSSRDVSVEVRDCYFSDNHDPSNVYAYCEISASSHPVNGVDGTVAFRNCFVNHSDWSAVYVSKTVDCYDLIFEDCVFKSVSRDTIAFNNPIFLEVTDYNNPVPRFGGVSFTDCAIVYDQDIPFLSLYENLATSPGLGNVNGNFFVVNPHPVTFESGANPNNVNVSFQSFTQAPPSIASLSAGVTAYVEGPAPLRYTVDRTGNGTLPMAIEVDYDGTADPGDDYALPVGFVLFPHQVTSVTDSLAIREDQRTEPLETVRVHLEGSPCLTAGADSSVGLTIGDVVTGMLAPKVGEMQIYPNPSRGEVGIRWAEMDWAGEVSVLGADGRIIQRMPVEGNQVRLNLAGWAPGMYWVKAVRSGSGEMKTGVILKY